MQWMLKCLGGWAGAGYLHALVPLPARASAAEVLAEVARLFPTSLPQGKERFRLQKIKLLQKIHLNCGSVQPLSAQLPCCLANPRARSIVKYLQPESLKAVSSACLQDPLPQKKETFYHSDIFLTNLQKTCLIFFLTMPCYLCLF